MLVWKFFAMTSFGVWASQSVSKNVALESKSPVSNTSKNSVPSGSSPVACRLCG